MTKAEILGLVAPSRAQHDRAVAWVQSECPTGTTDVASFGDALRVHIANFDIICKAFSYFSQRYATAAREKSRASTYQRPLCLRRHSCPSLQDGCVPVTSGAPHTGAVCRALFIHFGRTPHGCRLPCSLHTLTSALSRTLSRALTLTVATVIAEQVIHKRTTVEQPLNHSCFFYIGCWLPSDVPGEVGSRML